MANPCIEEWLNSAEGVKMNPDGHYGLQCVDLVDQYAQDIFGVAWPQSMGGVAGARQLLDAAPDAYWIRIDNDGSQGLIPQRGDVVVYGGNAANQWGHTLVCLDADIGGMDVIQQDGFAAPLQFVDNQWYSAKPAFTARLAYELPGAGVVTGWLRPREEKLLPPENPAPAKPTQCVVQSGDTMGMIAIQFGTTLGALIQANPKVKNPNLIMPGDVLNLPA